MLVTCSYTGSEELCHSKYRRHFACEPRLEVLEQDVTIGLCVIKPRSRRESVPVLIIREAVDGDKPQRVHRVVQLNIFASGALPGSAARGIDLGGYVRVM